MSSGLVLGQRPLGAILHSSNEPYELSQWLCHDDSTINIVLVIIIVIIIIKVIFQKLLCQLFNFFKFYTKRYSANSWYTSIQFTHQGLSMSVLTGLSKVKVKGKGGPITEGV